MCVLLSLCDNFIVWHLFVSSHAIEVAHALRYGDHFSPQPALSQLVFNLVLKIETVFCFNRWWWSSDSNITTPQPTSSEWPHALRRNLYNFLRRHTQTLLNVDISVLLHSQMHTQAASNGDKAYTHSLTICVWLCVRPGYFVLSPVCSFFHSQFVSLFFFNFETVNDQCVCVSFFWCYFTACLESIRHVISRRHIVETFLSPTN